MGEFGLEKFNFNKKAPANLKRFDGVSKDELIQKAGGANSKQGKLISSIFAKYDNTNDGYLDKNEYDNLQNDLSRYAKDYNLGKWELRGFNKNLSTAENFVGRTEYKMEDLQAVIGMMTDGTDDITDVTREGNTLTVKHKPEKDGGVKTEIFNVGAGKPVLVKNIVVNNGETTTTAYANDGSTIQSKTRVKGTVTEELDPQNGDRVKSRTTDKGSGVLENVSFDYAEDGSVTETYYSADINKPSKIVKKDKDGNVISTREYNLDGTYKETTNAQGQGLEHSEAPQPTKYKVKKGEFWYNIVQAKYGVNDHKTIMAIVHQLKDAANISRTQTTMPSEITLPQEVKVGEQTFTLNNEVLPSTVSPAPESVADLASAPAEAPTAPKAPAKAPAKTPTKTQTKTSTKTPVASKSAAGGKPTNANTDIKTQQHIVRVTYDTSNQAGRASTACVTLPDGTVIPAQIAYGTNGIWTREATKINELNKQLEDKIKKAGWTSVTLQNKNHNVNATVKEIPNYDKSRPCSVRLVYDKENNVGTITMPNGRMYKANGDVNTVVNRLANQAIGDGWAKVQIDATKWGGKNSWHDK